jgi:hypothetical protein
MSLLPNNLHAAWDLQSSYAIVWGRSESTSIVSKTYGLLCYGLPDEVSVRDRLA